jgi:hypothetical protein
MKTYLHGLLISAAAVGLFGCGQKSAPNATSSASSVNIDGSKFLLVDEPEEAMGVIEARESAENGAPIVVVGRIGGAANPWIEGRAAFMLLDASMAMVTEGEDDEEGELCTGDCCAADRAGCTTLVKVVDAEGKVIAADSRQLLGLSADDTVVVRGKANKDESGNFVVLAEGIYVRR